MTLDTLVDNACHHAVALFAEGHAIRAINVLFEDDAGEVQVIYCPMELSQALRPLLLQKHARRYAAIIEIWTDMDAGKDAVIVVGGDRDGNTLGFKMDIDRSGQTPRLAEPPEPFRLVTGFFLRDLLVETEGEGESRTLQ